MFVLVALVVTLTCVAASARRLVFAVAPTALDAAVLLAAVRDGRALRVYAALAADPRAEWERDLADALAAPIAARAALVNEQLTELDYRARRWSRVPRVCASVATSTSFLLASLALRAALAPLPLEAMVPGVNGPILAAIDVAAIGLAGAAFCVAIQARARSVVRGRHEAADTLVERLEAMAARTRAATWSR